MTTARELLQEALDAWTGDGPAIELDRIRAFLAQPEPESVAWRRLYSSVIKALAAIVNVHTPDKLFDLDAIPRDPVMAQVQNIRVALDAYAAQQKPSARPCTCHSDDNPPVPNDARDAARYRFAKSMEGQVLVIDVFRNHGADALDAAIDAAIAQEQQR